MPIPPAAHYNRIYSTYYYFTTWCACPDDDLEPLETEPPLMLLLVCDWIYTKVFGSCRAKPASRQSSVQSDV